MSLFQKAVLNKYLKSADQNILKEKYQLFSTHFLNSTIQENIRNSKEEQYQEGFLNDLFVNIFGYTKNPTPNYNLTTELKNVKDSKKVDGAILINSNTKAVIELKGMNTTDLSSIETQAFGYKNNHPECTYVITSNFQKIRFYIDNAIEHLEFDLFNLSFEDFQILYLSLAFENISNDIPKRIKDESLTEESDITKKLYKDYSTFKRELYQNILEQNPTFEPLLLFKKTQKLIDRFLFLFFAEDRGLLQPNSVRTIVDRWQKLKDLDAYSPLIDNYRKYFGYLNTGYTSNDLIVFAYNGGLFAPDEVLDKIEVDDELLKKHTLKIAKYDFASEVDVNILGHIFENSLNELEEVQAEIKGEVVEKTKTKRKKDGVFYTPKYITKYIVENTVGKLCNEKKAELKLIESDYHSEVIVKKLTKKQKEEKKYLLDKLDVYRNWLLQITICDPACGSGAFLNQALDFLITEHRYIDELQANLFGDALILTDIEGSILENNLYGVDINEESIEIAKLSLWLRTAEPNRKLTSLSNNLKTGNSLIDDIEVAGEKAFNWENEFSHVFAKGGFDVIIGNPPYGAQLDDKSKEFLSINYKSSEYQVNTYVAFYEKGINILTKNGLLGYITPATFTYQHYFSKIRNILLSYNQIAISKYYYEVFEDADIGDSVTWILQKNENKFQDIIIQICYNKEDALLFGNKVNYDDIVKNSTYQLNSLIFNIDKLNFNSKLLNEISNIIVGIKPYQTNKGIPKQTKEIVQTKIYNSNYKKDDSFIQCVIGKDFHKYKFLNTPELFLSYGKWLAEPRESAPFFNDKKIILRQTSDSLIANIDDNKFINLNNVYNVGDINSNYEILYILSLINSKLINFFYQNISQEKGRTFAEVKKVNLSKLPIKIISLNEQQPFVEMADKMLALNKEVQNTATKFSKLLATELGLTEPSKKLQEWYNLEFIDFTKELKKKKIELSLSQKSEWMEFFETEKEKVNSIQAEIDATDKQIDQMVYNLYELTAEEIEIVENA
ncbi:N-6 DNA methylase [Empedobacter stercoris]|uniref:Eco57I restriction-modification methylase domain-containing protein n=1 Tax=Empedobacter stercoris TaxID=1628248 RepID=UPI0016624B31|nr:TaqI-like C-terminal specificity domain-containing protein [Empedobacter stercoris]MCA4809616.1 N-6 DNA methylase [Empedobacter stercoris]QNT13539.1 N-6 DNA methylase [Empedobacter stercoris]